VAAAIVTFREDVGKKSFEAVCSWRR